jgi:acyl-coenzyme A synthetase/AMP-(fatty) acid ligase
MASLPLARLFMGDRRPEHPVALGLTPADQPLVVRTQAQFAAAAARAWLAARGSGRRRWVLACEDAWDFAAGLFGLLAAQRTVVLPPNFLPGTVAMLERMGGEECGVLRTLPDPGTHRAGLESPPAEPIPGGRVEFWTSGSSGEPKRLAKDLAQLEAEVAMLERTFGAALGDARVMVGTVPHHHIYGCLFRVLWPLYAGRPFLVEPCGDPDGFRLVLGRIPAPALVASPAHLSRLPALVDLAALPAPPGAVFSSGGPLAAADALAWRARVPAGVAEIYGSTETGGIAWRSQGPDPDSALWTPLDDVTLAYQDRALVVTSFRAGGVPLRLEDAAEPAGDGRFRLLGRLDRVVKLEEKRISLPELEKALEAHPWVARAALVVLGGPRPVLGAVVVPEAGAPSGRKDLVRGLRAHLGLRFEGQALPRRWRFPAELPYDERGKLTARTLAELFGTPADRIQARP